MRRLIPLFILLSLSLGLSAQSETDALRYARTNPAGTARSTAMGGAFGSLGGDFGSMLQNPAGLGVYRKPEVSFTSGFYYNGTDAQYSGTTSKDWLLDLDITHFSYVGSLKSKGGLLKAVNFGVGVNTVNNYRSNIGIQGNGIASSFVDPIVASANTSASGYPAEPKYLNAYSDKLFYDGYIIDMDNSGNYYLSTDIRDSSGNINLNQQNTIERGGKMNQWSFGLGFNVGHKLYFGGSFDVTPVDFRETSYFSEEDAATSNEYFSYEQIEIIEGRGFGAKVGVIFKPIKMLRVGLAYHTPTQYNFSRYYYSTILSNGGVAYVPIDPEGYELSDSVSTYSLRTPSKLVASASLMLGKFLILSTDLEYLDYSSIRYEARHINTDFAEENHALNNELSSAINLRTGAEVRLGMLYLRGGFAYLGSPYEVDATSSLSYQLNYSGGIGLRMKSFYIDCAVSYQDSRSTEVLYDSSPQAGAAIATINSATVQAITTFGIRF